MNLSTASTLDLKSLLQSLIALLNADAWQTIDTIIRRLPNVKSPSGLYEVLNYDTHLELHDPLGHQATFTKYQHVRFLQNNIIAYQDIAWGDGKIFAGYKCSPGKAVDHYREGHRHRVLVSLRQAKQRGEKLEFHVERKIKDGFLRRVEEWQTEVNHTTKRLSVKIVFPRERAPQHVWLIEQNTSRTTALGPEHRHTLPDGRCQIAWQIEKPHLYEAYILRWQW